MKKFHNHPSESIFSTQGWFWTEKWQQAECESLEDYEKGDFFEFNDAAEAIRFLNQLDKEAAKHDAEGQV